MARGHEEASTSKARCKRGTPQEKPTASSLVAGMFVEDLRSFRQVPAAIKLEMSDGATTSTMGAVDNAVYFTQEQCGAPIRHSLSRNGVTNLRTINMLTNILLNNYLENINLQKI